MGTDNIMEEINQIWNEVFGGSVQSVQPEYWYWEDKKGNRYCYTKEKVKDPRTGKLRYAAMIYRYYKTKKYYKLKKAVYFAIKKKAKARALKWLKKAEEKDK